MPPPPITRTRSGLRVRHRSLTQPPIRTAHTRPKQLYTHTTPSPAQPQIGNADATMLDGVVSVVVGENLDLGCSFIERAATEKAVKDVDKLLASVREASAGLGCTRALAWTSVAHEDRSRLLDFA